MKIEAGKFYKTRDGIKVLVIAVGLSLRAGKYNVVGVINDDIRGWYAGTDEPDTDGYYLGRWNGNHPNDLIAEWVDPPTPLDVCKYLVEWNDNNNPVFPFKEMVDKAREAIAAAEAK